MTHHLQFTYQVNCAVLNTEFMASSQCKLIYRFHIFFSACALLQCFHSVQFQKKIDISQGSVEICLRCVLIFNDHLTANLLLTVSTKQFSKLIHIWQRRSAWVLTVYHIEPMRPTKQIAVCSTFYTKTNNKCTDSYKVEKPLTTRPYQRTKVSFRISARHFLSTVYMLFELITMTMFFLFCYSYHSF